MKHTVLDGEKSALIAGCMADKKGNGTLKRDQISDCVTSNGVSGWRASFLRDKRKIW